KGEGATSPNSSLFPLAQKKEAEQNSFLRKESSENKDDFLESNIHHSTKTQNITFDVVSNPEFLKEGVAIKDFMSPDRVVIGTDSTRALEVMKALYAPFLLKSDRLIAMGIESAEMTKYAANAMLATKISFINEMSQICERVGANINDVRQGIGSDSRIGYSFIYPGCGYGGSCFPKDVRALEKSAKDVGYTARILQAVQEVNEKQKMLLVEKIVRHFGENLQGLSFCVWGLSFKPETDDMREASSLVLINELIGRGATIQAYDPKAYEQARFYLKDKLSSITFMESKYSALQGCAALVLLTEWREFRSPDFGEIAKLLQEPIIFDGRNIYQHCGLESKGFKYYQIGVAQRV
uniref:UDP-glucose dehydrogenase family protein n=1 Tax=Helicobacter cinaedi TaxID=213 RepID=UPI0013156249